MDTIENLLKTVFRGKSKSQKEKEEKEKQEKENLRRNYIEEYVSEYLDRFFSSIPNTSPISVKIRGETDNIEDVEGLNFIVSTGKVYHGYKLFGFDLRHVKWATLHLNRNNENFFISAKLQNPVTVMSSNIQEKTFMDQCFFNIAFESYPHSEINPLRTYFVLEDSESHEVYNNTLIYETITCPIYKDNQWKFRW